MHSAFSSDFLNLMLSFFINRGNELLSTSTRYKGVTNELKTEIKEAIKAKESKEWSRG